MGNSISYRNNFLSNIAAWKAQIVRQTARETGFEVYIGDSMPMATADESKYVGVYTDDGRDHSPFWKRYEEILSEFTSEE